MHQPTTIVFAPHPDDEVIACGGAILAARAAGRHVKIVFATDGSRSHDAVLGIRSNPSPDELAVIRQGEAVEAARILGVAPDDLVFAGAPDTRLCDALDVLRATVDAVLASCMHVDEVYIPHERRELNADHRHTGEIVLERMERAGLRPRIYRYVVWDESTEMEFAFMNRPASQALSNMPSNTPSATLRPGTRRDISSYLERKLQALRAHRTQTELYSPSQTRPVIPDDFMARICARSFEEFWEEAATLASVPHSAVSNHQQ